MRAGIQWDFESYPGVPRARSSGAASSRTWRRFVGHSSVRTYVLGEDATKRAATDGRDRGDAAARAGSGQGGRHRLRDLHARAAQRRRRHPDALPAGGREGDARAHGRARRGRARRLHADQGHDLHHPLAREDRGRQRPARHDRGHVRGPGRSHARLQGAGRDRAGARPRPRALGAGGLLPARHGVHAPPPLPARGADGVAARDDGARSGALPRRSWPIRASAAR